MKTMDRETRKFGRLWKIGGILSFAVYYSGVLACYRFIVKKVLKRHHGVILAYHRVQDSAEDAHMSVRTRTFERQIDYLQKHFQILSLDRIEESRRYPEKEDCCIITFDDGYRDNYLNAYPVLKKRHVPAAIFVVSGNVGKSSKWVSGDEMRDMVSHSMTIGSHTVSHPLLTDISSDEAFNEIMASKIQLEEMLGKTVDYFAYPRGKRTNYNETIRKMVENSGYKAAVTMENGLIGQERNRFELKRIGIRECPSYVFKVRVSGFFESPPFLWIRNLLKI